MLAHLSPALTEHVNRYGSYTFPIEKIRELAGYRPLRLAEPTGTVSL